MLRHSQSFVSILTVLSVTSGKFSWFIDFAFCNYMTSDSILFFHKTVISPNPIICFANGSHIFFTHISITRIGSISSSYLFVDDVYLVSKLSLNLLPFGQLIELGLRLIFVNDGIGTSCKVERLFELTSLQIPTRT